MIAAEIDCFNKLYDRDSRRSFAPEGHWLWPAVAASELQSAVLNVDDDAVADRGKSRRATVVLSGVPQVIPFDIRVALFDELLRQDQVCALAILRLAYSVVQVLSIRGMQASRPQWGGHMGFRVRRATMVEDTMDAFGRFETAKASLKSR
jgi:hypothetical protein